MIPLDLPGFEQRKHELSQWFTPPQIAARIAEIAVGVRTGGVHVLEPSCGDGALIRACLDTGRVARVQAYDIDPRMVGSSRERFAGYPEVAVAQADFLALEPPRADAIADVAVMNPTFEGGAVALHVMHALQFAPRVVCHCPLTTLEGKHRRESLWSRVNLHALHICSTRPKYGAASSGATAMCTIEVTLTCRREAACQTTVSWWP